MMRKHKLILPLLLGLLLFFLGTSLALGIFNNGGNQLNEDLAENADPIESSSFVQAETDPDPEQEQSPPEETADDEQQAASLEAEKEGEEKPVAKTAKVKEKEKTESPAPKPAEEKAKKDMVTVTADSLNVRPDPSTNNQPIDSLSRGQKVEVIKEQNNWLQVQLPDGRVGWVAGAYVDRPSSSSSSSKGSLSGKVIVLDPGHGGHDPGAVGVTGLREKDVVLDVALRAAKQLRAKGAKVVMTRDTDVFIPLTQRVAIAEAAGANVFVSVHANVHPSAQIGGTETYYYGYKASSGASRDLATHMQRRLVGSLGLRDIGVKDANFLVIWQTSMPSTLLELAFLSNAREEALMRTDEFRQNAADGIVGGLLDYFK
jgi:N-acetylmuramoyl-L-alanine amidase